MELRDEDSDSENSLSKTDLHVSSFAFQSEEWYDDKTFPKTDLERWNRYVETEDGYESYNGEYVIMKWNWPDRQQVITEIYGFPGDNPVGVVFLGNDENPILTQGDRDYVAQKITKPTVAQKAFLEYVKEFAHLSNCLYNSDCDHDHPHCFRQIIAYHRSKEKVSS